MPEHADFITRFHIETQREVLLLVHSLRETRKRNERRDKVPVREESHPDRDQEDRQAQGSGARGRVALGEPKKMVRTRFGPGSSKGVNC